MGMLNPSASGVFPFPTAQAPMGSGLGERPPSKRQFCSSPSAPHRPSIGPPSLALLGTCVGMATPQPHCRASEQQELPRVACRAHDTELYPICSSGGSLREPEMPEGCLVISWVLGSLCSRGPDPGAFAPSSLLSKVCLVS